MGSGQLVVVGSLALGAQRRVRGIAALAYEQAMMPPCCDPRDLAEGLGLRVIPSGAARASIVDGALRFPSRATLPARGRLIYQSLAKYLLRSGTMQALPEEIEALTNELALPFHIIKTCTISGLSELQPHYPRLILEHLVMRVRDSGVMTKTAR